MSEDLTSRVLAAIVDQETKLQAILSNQASYGEEMDGGWEVWGQFGRLVYDVVDFKKMLRRCTADRKIVAEHEGYHSCGVLNYGDDDPCPTLIALAEGYGIEA